MIRDGFFRYSCFFVLSFFIVLFSDFIESKFIRPFFLQSSVVLLVALFAINTAARTALLGKLKELDDKYSFCFNRTISSLKLALREQLYLICISFLFSLFLGSDKVSSLYWVNVLVVTVLGVCFIGSLQIVYDTTNAIMLLISEQQESR